MSTAYGTIPTSNNSVTRSAIGIRRPWKEMLSFSLPENFDETLIRVKNNASYFHVNYAMIVLFMLFLSLLWHPLSLIVFIFTMAAWLFLYFIRDNPIVLFGYGVDERVILVVLSVFTVVVLLFTHATVFLVGLIAGLVVVLLHGVFRRTNLSIFDEEEGRVDSVHLKETASASYSSP